MKNVFLGLVTASLATSGFANGPDCIKHLDNHLMGNFGLYLNQCNLQDSDIPLLNEYLIKHSEIDTLFLIENNIGAEGAKALAKNARLDTLILDSNHIGTEGAIALSKLPAIEYLSLAHNYIGEKGILALARMQTPYAINVNYNDLTEKTVIALAKNPNLFALGIAGASIERPAWNALMEMKQLTAINVSDTTLTPDNILALGTKANVSGIAANNDNIDDRHAASFLRNHNLVILQLAGNNITSLGLNAGYASSYLIQLDLSDNPIGDEGAKIISQEPPQELIIKNIGLNDDGAIALANNKGFILALDVRFNPFGTTGYEALSRSAHINVIAFDDTSVWASGSKKEMKLIPPNIKQPIKFDLYLFMHPQQMETIRINCLIKHNKDCKPLTF